MLQMAPNSLVAAADRSRNGFMCAQLVTLELVRHDMVPELPPERVEAQPVAQFVSEVLQHDIALAQDVAAFLQDCSIVVEEDLTPGPETFELLLGDEHLQIQRAALDQILRR